jgi:hypothetical protein
MILRTLLRQKIHALPAHTKAVFKSLRGFGNTPALPRIGVRDIVHHTNELFEYDSGRWL